MRVLVVGAGAVGSFLGWAVAAGGGETTLVRRGVDVTPGVPVSVRMVRPDGTEAPVEVGVVGSVKDAADASSPDLVIVAVRQYDLPAALASLVPLPVSALLTAQNGVGAEEATAAARPATTLLAASVTASVEREPDGSVRWLRRGGVGLAAVRGDTDDLIERLTSTFRAAGVDVVTHRDAAAMKWSKLIANLVANATSGLLDQDPPSIYANPGLFAVERDQLREALAVMRARHLRPVSLPGAPVPLLALATALPTPLARAALRRVVGSARGGKDPSLRGAVQQGGPTEAGWLNGAVARTGAELGVATPVNAALARLVEQAAADPERRAWFRHRPDRLLEALGRS
jgi:2-dehydropantoate 2-reductase